VNKGREKTSLHGQEKRGGRKYHRRDLKVEVAVSLVDEGRRNPVCWSTAGRKKREQGSEETPDQREENQYRIVRWEVGKDYQPSGGCPWQKNLQK